MVSGLNHHDSRIRASLSIDEVTASMMWEMAEATKTCESMPGTAVQGLVRAESVSLAN